MTKHCWVVDYGAYNMNGGCVWCVFHMLWKELTQVQLVHNYYRIILTSNCRVVFQEQTALCSVQI